MQEIEEDLLAENELKEDVIENVQTVINVKVEGVCETALIDIGSTISGISEDFYNQIKSTGTVEFPVTGVRIKNATGSYSKPVNKEVVLDLMIEDELLSQGLLIIKGLCINLVLGNDFLCKYGAQLDYKDKVLELSLEG